MMVSSRLCLVWRRITRLMWFLLLSGLATSLSAPASAADRAADLSILPAALEKAAPESVQDLRAIQDHVQMVLKKVLPCTVGVRIGGAWGSGVIVRADGYVLTAGHVSAQPDRDVTVLLADGRRVKGKTLGANHGVDSGLVKISEEGTWPFAPMGNSADLQPGQWCLATGHPGGYKPGRTPVVRLGRVLDVTDKFIQTDCTLVGGDSGGPLFDVHGRVIGIHSRIGRPLSANLHVPVDAYRQTWDRLVKAEVWGSRLDGRFGMDLDTNSRECRIAKIAAGALADKAGFQVDDVIVRFDGQKINNSEDLVALVAQARRRRPGDEVAVEVLRGQKTVTLKLVIGRRDRRPPE
jgi:serine protease Do